VVDRHENIVVGLNAKVNKNKKVDTT